MTVSALRLRPIQTPSTIARIITSTVATRVTVRVTMASCHRPISRMIAEHTAVVTDGLRSRR